MTTQIETAADRYRRIKQERLNNTQLFEYTTPSGMEWKLRKVDLQLFILSGTLPLSLAAKIAKAQQGGKSEQEAFADLDLSEQIKTLEFTQAIVRFCAVSPRIVDNPTPGADEIAPHEVEADDYNAISNWAMTGGEAAEGLETFRSE